MDSPRGRIYQILNVNEGKLPLAESYATHIDRCLGCLACETACPSGVQYGHLIERARAQIERAHRRVWLVEALRRFFFERVLSSYGLLLRLSGLMRIYQRTGLQR